MKRVAIVAGIIAATATGGAAAAAGANAAPTCPAPVVSVSPQTNVNQNGTLTITAQHLFCTTSSQNGKVDFSLSYPGFGSAYSKTGIAVPPSGDVTYQWHLSSTYYNDPAGTKVPLLLEVYPPGTATSTSVAGPTITLAAPPPGASSSMITFTIAPTPAPGGNAAPTPAPGGNAAPTAVPAGHVDVSRSGAARLWEGAAVAFCGLALTAGGAVAVTRRRTASH